MSSGDNYEGIGCGFSLIFATVITALTEWSLFHEYGWKYLLATPVVFIVLLVAAMGAWSGVFGDKK